MNQDGNLYEKFEYKGENKGLITPNKLADH